MPIRETHLIITNQRLILRDLQEEFLSFEIPRSILSVSKVTYKTAKTARFPAYELIIETGRKNYSIRLHSGVRERVEQLIPARA
jgi:hypothetical protein